jgi:ribosome-associated protein
MLESSRSGAKTKAPRRSTRARSDSGASSALILGDRARPTRKPHPKASPSRQALAAPSGPLASATPPLPPLRDTSRNWSVASEASRKRAATIAIAALDKKAVGLEILDVAGKVDYADFIVIMTGRSDRHTQALAQGIEEALKTAGVRPMAVEGLPHGNWVLMDFGDVVVHVFQDEARQLYDIEGLWLDVRRLPVPSSSTPKE